MELFSNLIDNPRDDHGNDIDIVHEFADWIERELCVIEEFSNINNRYFLPEMDDRIDMSDHGLIESLELNPIA